jgi:hypothetical protein
MTEMHCVIMAYEDSERSGGVFQMERHDNQWRVGRRCFDPKEERGPDQVPDTKSYQTPCSPIELLKVWRMIWDADVNEAVT